MVLRLMLASAAAFAIAAATFLGQPEAPSVRVATRAEFLAAHPQTAGVVPAACTPVPAAKPAAADI